MLTSLTSDTNSNRILLNTNEALSKNAILKTFTIEENVSMDIELTVNYILQAGKIEPNSYNGYLTGLVSGYEWQLNTVNVEYVNTNDTTILQVHGVLIWNLFGIECYRNRKTFNQAVNF